jgi:hypothetical protein
MIDIYPGSTLKNGSLTIRLVEQKLFPLRKVRAEASTSFDECQHLLSSDFVQHQGMCRLKVAVPMPYRLAVIQSLSSTKIQRSALTFSHKYVVNTLRL